MTKGKNGLLFSSIILAITSSLCCIAPLLAIVGGISGAASSFTWVQPFRPYLIALTIIVLGFSFYQAYKPVKPDSCGCTPERKPFLQSKTFVWSITIVSILLMTFPYYSAALFPVRTQNTVHINALELATDSFKVIGMTCESCEQHVNSVLLQQTGVVEASANYKDSMATIKYDKSKISLPSLMAEVSTQTGYKTIQ